MKRTGLLAALCMVTMLILPQTGSAGKVALCDADLSEVTARTGLAEETTTTFNTYVDNMPVMNGVLSLSDVNIEGSVTTKDTSTSTGNINQMTNPDLSGLGMIGRILGVMGFGKEQIDQTINLDRLSIGAIHIGKDTTGASLGSFNIRELRTDIKGTAPITSH